MATSLGFGVIFATAITLILIPVNYTLLVDLKLWLGLKDDPSGETQDEEEGELLNPGGA